MTERVAIVHDWLTSMRGGERVVEALCSVFPQADLYTLTWDPARLSPALARRRATTSAIHSVANAPFVSGRFRALLPLFPLAVESFKLDGYSLVVSSSHCVAIGALAPASALHVAYVHSTLRYAHEAQGTYEASVPGGQLGRALFRGTAQYLRRWEAAAATRPHVLIANSTYTRQRILRYYQRDAQVIEPPIETRRFERAAARVPSAGAHAPYLLVSALVPNKRVDLALRAFQGRSERLVIVGEGPERARLERLLGPNTTLLARLEEGELAALFARCRALLHTGIDDFGMVMVEALAAGKPVLACAEGGALDIVRDGETGLLIREPTVECVRAALDRLESRAEAFDPAVLRSFARRFDRANFERRFARAVDEARDRRDSSAPAAPRRAGNGVATSPAGLHGNGHLTVKVNGAANGNGTVKVKVDAVSNGNGAANGNGMSSGNGATKVNGVASGNGTAHGHAQVRGGASGQARADAHAAKRAFDVTVAAFGLVVTAPLVVGLGVLVSLDSPGPPLFYQARAGRNRVPFTIVKLRTMDAQGRVTSVGRFLRPTGFDELPQLWNVLSGDMSLIGPRPEVLDRIERHERDVPGYPERYRIRPGITGWAQVNGLRGDNNVSIAERLRFDTHYLREWSPALDGRILLRTVSTVLRDTLRSLRS
jgi:lipopolysaccharide/colanic/teichoic acid biosynthesis glycosyltransferase/glycosyltransferase involved in cell wall biosynthesis